MSAQIFYNNGSSSSEIITHLVNASDGAGLHFTGASGTYVDCGDTTILDGATRCSVEVIAATSATAEGEIFSKCKDATAFRLYFKADGKVHFRLHNSSSNGDATSAGSYNDGNPKHIVATWDALKLRIYINGNLDGEGDLVGGSFRNVADHLAIGAMLSASSSTSFFNGDIYRARLWNRDVSADVQSLFENASIDYADQWGSQTELSTNTFVNAGFAGFSGNAGGFTTSGSASNNAVYKNQTFTAGKKYRLKFTIADGNSSNLLLLFRSSAGGAGANVGKIDSSNLGTVVSDTYLQLEATGNYELILSDIGSAQSIRIYAGGDVGAINISAFSVVAIGCAFDLDLAYANPTQSTIVQNRSGSGDGTAAGGVTQISPIEQLNSKALRVGTSAATVADGELLVSGKVGVGGAPLNALQVGSAYPITLNGSYPQIHFNGYHSSGYKAVTAGFASHLYLDASNGSLTYNVGPSSVSANTDYSPVTALTISSAGAVTIGSNTTGAQILKINGNGDSGDGVSLAFQTVGTTKSQIGRQSGIIGGASSDNLALFAAAGLGVNVYTGGSSAARLSISSAGLASFSNGIAFQSATTGTGTTASGYTLNAYEVGTFTPTVTSATGTITTVSATGTYTRVGRVVSANFDIIVTTNGSGAGTLNATLPFTGIANDSYAIGREVTAVGFSITGTIGTGLVSLVKTSNDLYPAADGYRLKCSTVYQAA